MTLHSGDGISAVNQSAGRRMAVWLTPVVCILAFALAVQEFVGVSHAIDRLLLFGLPGPFSAEPEQPRHLVALAWNLTALGSPQLCLLGAAAIAFGLFLGRQYLPAIFLLGTVISGAAFGLVLKKIFGTLWPHRAPGGGLDAVLYTSFPSGHALLATLFLMSLAAIVRWLVPENRLLTLYAYCLAIALIAGVGISRFYLGLHWPSDVVAGWAAGALWIWLSNRALPLLQRGDAYWRGRAGEVAAE
jgi:undecaprenyl-diphosphatase